MSTENLPTKKEFQQLADKLKSINNITRCQANEQLAKYYGYKNYGAIKSSLKNKPVMNVPTIQIVTAKDFKKYNSFDMQMHIIDGIAYNPRLSSDFYYMPNQDRSSEELDNWWNIAYMVSRVYDNQVSYTIYCLDGGAWDRPTRKGDFDNFEDALNTAQSINDLESKGPNRYQTLKNGSVVNPSGLFISRTGERTDAIVVGRSIKSKNISKAKYFIDSIMKHRQNINKSNGSSYHLKHRVEEFIKYYFPKEDYYLSNGEFIIALDELNYKLKEIDDGYSVKSLNIYTNYKTLTKFTENLEKDKFKIYCSGLLDILK